MERRAASASPGKELKNSCLETKALHQRHMQTSDLLMQLIWHLMVPVQN
jgi:hypothetical protein